MKPAQVMVYKVIVPPPIGAEHIYIITDSHSQFKTALGSTATGPWRWDLDIWIWKFVWAKGFRSTKGFNVHKPV